MADACRVHADGVLSDQLLALGRLARTESPPDFLRAAVARMGDLVPYVGAWWGLCFDRGPDVLPDVVHAEVIGLPASMTLQWRQVGVDDP